MNYVNAFLFTGTIALISEILLNKTKLTPGHITSLFVVIGAFLDVFDIYDKLILWAGGGAIVPITSFGHLLSHGSMMHANDTGIIGLTTGMFNLTSSGIMSAIVFSFFFAVICKPKD
ncbi:MAG: stage V sporulation protein AE [Mycoplasmatota bacterium]